MSKYILAFKSVPIDQNLTQYLVSAYQNLLTTKPVGSVQEPR